MKTTIAILLAGSMLTALPAVAETTPASAAAATNASQAAAQMAAATAALRATVAGSAQSRDLELLSQPTAAPTVTGTPAAAVAGNVVEDNKRLLRLIGSNARLMGYCEGMGFQIGKDDVERAVNDAGTRLSMAGMSDAEIKAIADDALAHQTPTPTLPGAGSNFTTNVATIEAFFAAVQPMCDALADDPLLHPYFRRAGYQRTPGPKSWFGQQLYDANAGDVADMVLVGRMYENDMEPDPDGTLAFNWLLRAAEAGDAGAAMDVATFYATGHGTPRDPIEAEKWALIAEARGDTSGLRPKIEALISDYEKTQGHQHADAYLTAHPAK